MGRLTKYKKTYCKQIVDFFNREPYEIVTSIDEETGAEIALTDRNGNPVMKPCKLPTIEGFARIIGVHRDTINEWQRVHEDFNQALQQAKDMQKDILIQNGLIGAYEKTVMIFVAKNCTDMTDAKEHTHKGDPSSPIRNEWHIHPVEQNTERSGK